MNCKISMLGNKPPCKQTICCAECTVNDCPSRCLNSPNKCGLTHEKQTLTADEKLEKARAYAREHTRKKKAEDPEAYRAKQREWARKRREKEKTLAKQGL